MFRVNYVRVGYWFGSVELWVGSILGDATVTWFTSGIGPIYFGLGEIRFNIRVNVRSGTSWVE